MELNLRSIRLDCGQDAGVQARNTFFVRGSQPGGHDQGDHAPSGGDIAREDEIDHSCPMGACGPTGPSSAQEPVRVDVDPKERWDEARGNRNTVTVTRLHIIYEQ